MTDRQKEIIDSIKKDELMDAQPYLGGYNSDQAKILVVDFIPDSALYKFDLREKQYTQSTLHKVIN